MNLGTGLLIQRDVIDLLERKAILLSDGEFDKAKLDTLTENLDLASDIEDLLKARGLNVPGKVDQIIQALPIIAAFWA
jgi:hypothetical protein